jgi:hypothetical protein
MTQELGLITLCINCLHPSGASRSGEAAHFPFWIGLPMVSESLGVRGPDGEHLDCDWLLNGVTFE